MPRQIKIVVVLAFICLLLAALVLYSRSTENAVRNAYALESAAVLLVDYMKANENQWPETWRDLEVVAKDHIPDADDPHSYCAELQIRVVIDWTIDIHTFYSTAQGLPRAVSLPPGQRSAWNSDPNERIRAYLAGE